MKKKQFIRTLICAIVMRVSGVQAQNSLTFHQTEGNDQTVALSEIGKITFSDGNMILSDKTGAITTYLISDIENITFEATKTPASDIKSEVVSGELSIYPNPTSDIIYLKGLETLSQITIYTVEGRAVMNSQVLPDENINIASLPKGLYLLRVNNKTTKFNKL